MSFCLYDLFFGLITALAGKFPLPGLSAGGLLQNLAGPTVSRRCNSSLPNLGTFFEGRPLCPLCHTLGRQDCGPCPPHMFTRPLNRHNLTSGFCISAGRCDDRRRPHRGILCHKYISRRVYVNTAEMIDGPHNLIGGSNRCCLLYTSAAADD